MREEIRWLRPILMRGTPPGGGGHYWVVYGYNEATNELLMNLGWGPAYSGIWYTLDGLPVTDTSVGDMEYTVDQQVIMPIAPEGSVRFLATSGTGDGSPGDPYGGFDQVLADTGVSANTIVILEAGSVHTFTEELTLDRGMTLRSHDAVIRKE